MAFWRSIQTKIKALNRAGMASCFVDVNQHGVHLDVSFGDHEAGRHRVEKALENALLFHAYNGIVGPGHTDVRDEAGSLGQNVIVRRGDMGMSTENGRDFSVQEPAHRLLLRSGLRMYIDNDYFHFRRNFGDLGKRRAEGIVDRCHEGTSLQVKDGEADAILGCSHVETRARGTLREVGRTDQAGLVGHEIDNLPAVPNMISPGDHLDAAGEKFLGNAGSDPEARGGIFTVGDAEVYAALREDVRETVVDDFAARRTYDVTDK
jgi:hypothetical protein